MSLESALAISLARGPLVGTFLGLILYGVTCLQAFFYFQTYEDDRKVLKITVALLLAFETIHAALSMWVMDDYLIVHYADVSALQSANWPSTSTYIIGFVIDFFVYLYFTWRIWSFTENMYIVIFMSSISISRTVVSIIACVSSVMNDTWTSYLKHTRSLILTGNALFIVGDTLSASVMAYYLNKSKRQSGMYRTDLLINRLLIFAVATGGLTSLVDIIALIFTLTQPQSIAFMGPILVQTRLYANSLLTSLNIRNANARAYNAATDPQSGIDIELQFARPPDISATSQASGRQSAIGIRKSTAESWHTAQDSGTSSQPYV